MDEILKDAGAPSPTVKPASRLRRWVFGKPRDVTDRSLFHRLSLVAFLAWVGLGADGLSSSAYGPAQMYVALSEHTYLFVLLVLMTPATIFVIAAAYSRMIEAFPQGGGGYAVTTRTLGPTPGVIAGSALVVDYILTITVSIAAAGDAIFSLLPVEWLGWKVPVQVGLILLGIAANIRGVKDSILPLVPIFLLFLVMHAVLIVAGLVIGIPQSHDATSGMPEQFASGLQSLGVGGMLLALVKAYSMGGGTYTGIEAVSNGLNLMREPRVETAKRTMRYMAISLAVTATGLLLCFALLRVEPDGHSTLNAILGKQVLGDWPLGQVLVWALLLSEAAILVVAAQTGFIGGPRVLASMAADGWVPRQFSALSERLTTQNGIVLMGVGAILSLLAAGGRLETLVVIYSINVFIAFALSMAGMLRASLRSDWVAARRPWRDRLLFGTGFVMCSVILIGTVASSFYEGGWVTIVITSAFVGLCFLIRSEYRSVSRRVRRLEHDLQIPERAAAPTPPEFDPSKPTAAVFVGGYSGLGIHTLIQAMSLFGGHFKNVLFISAGVIDSGAFKGEAELAALHRETKDNLDRYVALAHRLGLPATSRFAVGIDVIDELERLSIQVTKEFPKVTFIAGQLVFQREQWHHRILHNRTAYALQTRLQWLGLPMLILPIRVR